MSRAIYEVELKQNMYTGLGETDILEQTQIYGYDLEADSLRISKRVGENLTRKLYMLAWQMSREEIFGNSDIENCLEAMLVAAGIRRGSKTADIIDCVMVYLDRFDDVDVDEETFLEWITEN